MWKITAIRINELILLCFRSLPISETITTQGMGSGVASQSGNHKTKRKKRVKTAKANRWTKNIAILRLFK